eukprot:TRINITY_DN693_c0_g1_i1.p1 TRINITY_DN693_c0_g1~~TRINITY_DN693_c0_g1_i1.p1  ORF type:complete len:410 (+),score=123.99 TRINITY_DN693_c0_g1_i1:56-1231(+)
MFKRAAPIGEQTETKRLKFQSDVEEKIDIVRKQVGNAEARSDECCVMLENMVPGSLGPAMDERDELQTEAVEMIGKVIKAIEDEAVDKVKLAEEICEDPESVKKKVEEAAERAQAEKAAAEKDKPAKQKAAQDAKASLAKADDTLRKANNGLHKLEDEKADLKDKRDTVEDAFIQHFVPIRDGDWEAESEALAHIRALGPVFVGFDYEKSLMAAFKEAGMNKPASRRSFDNQTIKSAAFEERKAELDKQIAAKAAPIGKAQKAQQAAEAAKAAAAQKYNHTLADLGNVTGAIRKSNADALRARQELDTFPATPQEAEAKRQRAKAALEELTGPKGAVSAYIYLRDRVSNGNGKEGDDSADNLFNQIDTDGDGVISKEEMAAGLSKGLVKKV